MLYELLGDFAFQEPIYLTVLRDAVADYAMAQEIEKAVGLAHALPYTADRAWTLFCGAERVPVGSPAFEALLSAGVWAVHAIEEEEPRARAIAALAVARARAGQNAAAGRLVEALDGDDRYRTILVLAFPSLVQP